MLKVFLISIVLVALCVIGLSISIIFKKNGKFPETEISKNKEMRKRGIVCMREEDEAIWNKKKKSCKDAGNKAYPSSECEICAEKCALSRLK